MKLATPPKPRTSLYHADMRMKSIFPIGLGAMPLSIPGRPNEKDAIEVITSFIELGGNFIDTADVYGLDNTDRGHNEKLIYKAVTSINAHGKVLVASKGGADRPQAGWSLTNGHPQQLRKACEQSLLNLHINAHSLYYLHGPDPKVPLAESFGELIKLKDEGKIINIGIANVDLREAQLACSMTKVAAIQNRFNPFCKEDARNGLIDFCKTHGIYYIAYCPLGGWADHQKLTSHSLYQTLQEKYQLSPYALNLTWIRQHGTHIIPIPGMDKKDHIRSNFQALSCKLSLEDKIFIDNFPDLYSAKHKDEERGHAINPMQPCLNTP